jgi:hypothetical protein
VQTVDVTFRVGRIIAGVSVDTAPGVEADRDLAIDLSRRLEERISAVLGGESLDLIDLTLPGQLATLGSGWTGRNEGYLSSAELLGSELGPEFEPAFVTGYFRVTVMGDPSVGFPLPALNIAVARFADEAGPLSLMSRLDEFQAQFVGLERVTIDRIPGTSAAVAFKYANPAVAGSDIDSFRVLMVVDSSLVTLDIQGNATIEGAQEAALKIAEAQAACLGSASDCPPLTLAEGLLAPPSNPGSEPVG